MAYKVIPFNADLVWGQGAQDAAAQLEGLVNQMGGHGWTFHGLESIETVVTTPSVPGSNGCLGIGAVPGTPERRNTQSVYVAVFSNRQQ
jgi:hypothetical protein